MTFIKKLEYVFILAVFLALGYIAYNWYESRHFKLNPLSDATQEAIKQRQDEVLALIRKHYGLDMDIPLIVSDRFSSQLYGLTQYKDSKIRIYLNKKRFKESEAYMLEEVIPHEYAHALIFTLKKSLSRDGHTVLWQKICLELDGKRCERYVDNEEIISQKMSF